MKYIQLFNENLVGEVVESLGSFPVAIVDGRLRRSNIEKLGYELLVRENKQHKKEPYYVGFKIYQGTSFRTARPLTELIT
jgi:hypothetical protein